MYCRQTSLPASECVSLAVAKNYLRVPSAFTNDDADITGFIQAAREKGEGITWRGLAQRTWRLALDGFPGRMFRFAIDGEVLGFMGPYGYPWGSGGHNGGHQTIELPFGPVVSVQQVRYIDPAGNPQVLQQDVDFILDRETEPARLVPVPAASIGGVSMPSFWPITLSVPNAVIIDYTAGYDPNPAATDTHDVTLLPGPTVVFQGGGGDGATAHAVLTGSGNACTVSDIVVDNGGDLYTSVPTVYLQGTGSSCVLQATVVNGIVTAVAVLSSSADWSSAVLQQPDSVLVTGVPQMIILGIKNLVAYWYQNRGEFGTVPDTIENIFRTYAVYSFK